MMKFDMINALRFSRRASLMMALLLLVPAGPILSTHKAMASAAPNSFADLAEQVKHSVVNISTTQVVKGMPNPFGPNSPFHEFFGDDFSKHFFGEMPQKEMKTHALGSGFVVDSKGLILTNNHVVEKATEISVKLDTGTEYKATVLGRDPKTDLALIKVKPDGNFPPPVPLGDSDSIRVGDWVMAVGNPFGLGQTVTVGVISAKSRIIGAGPYDDFLQTDAAINPGNSGGPLFDMHGQVIGIDTAIIAQGQGIGFAIPINLAKELLPQLESGKIVRGYLGISIQDLTPELAKSFGLKDVKGVLIAGLVSDGPAEAAGLAEGDVITSIDGKPVADAHALSRMVAMTPPNTQISLNIVRNNENKTIKVTVGTMPQNYGEAGSSGSEERTTSWGFEVQDITPQIAKQLGVSPHQKGVVITQVEPGSSAATAGLREGDIIREVNRKTVNNTKDFNKAISGSQSGKQILLLVKRGEGSIYVVMQQGGPSE